MNEEKTIVILKLFEPAYQLAPFCPEANENYVKIVFNNSLSGILFYLLITLIYYTTSVLCIIL